MNRQLLIFLDFLIMVHIRIVVFFLFWLLIICNLLHQTLILLSKHINLSFIRLNLILHNLNLLAQRLILLLRKLQHNNSILQLFNLNIFLLQLLAVQSSLILLNYFDLFLQLFIVLDFSFHSIIVFDHLIKVIC